MNSPVARFTLMDLEINAIIMLTFRLSLLCRQFYYFVGEFPVEYIFAESFVWIGVDYVLPLDE